MDSDIDAMDIEVLEGVEPIRRRPTMYVGPLDSAELPVRLLRQALCHAADCALDGTCSTAHVDIDGREVTVSYDAGIPLESDRHRNEPVARLFLTMMCACRNLKKHIEAGDELCDLGLAALNALCSTMTLETWWQGRTASFVFQQGREVGATAILPGAGGDRTVLRFRLDPTILASNVEFDVATVRSAVEQIRRRVPALVISVEAR